VPVWGPLSDWAQALGCSKEPQVHKIESGIERLSYCDADGNATLVVYLIDGLGHHWPGGRAALNPTIAGQPAPWFDATAKIWAFFSEGGLP